MKLRAFVTTAVMVAGLAAVAFGAEKELADQINTGYETLSTPVNQQKFLSILIFVICGGGVTYAVMRGIKKIVHTD
jgi:hypothetical protein